LKFPFSTLFDFPTRFLCLSRCFSISDAAVKAIADNCSYLQRIHLNFCNVSGPGLNEISLSPLLTALSFPPLKAWTT
jgi:hypothetical protein